MRADLNVDIGEGFAQDEALLRYASSANVCCGEHAGSWELTLTTIQMCLEHGIRIGCHPGYPDRPNMGRLGPDVIPAEWFDSLFRQVEQFCSVVDCTYVKPHGAWYNQIVAGHKGACQILGEIQNQFGLPVMMVPFA